MRDNLNLTPERGPNVWEKRPEGGRWKSEVGGAVMMAAGVAAAVVGGRMLYRAARADSAARDQGRTPGLRDADQVAYESAESFPASDSPSWTASGALLDLPRKRP